MKTRIRSAVRALGIVAPLVAVALTAPAYGKPRGGGPEHGPGPGFGMGFGMAFLNELDLSAEQRDKIKSIRQGGKERTQQLRQEAFAARDALKQAMGGTAESAELSKLFQEWKTKHEALMAHGFEQMLKLREVLTVEQRQQIVKRLDERGPRGRHGGKGGPRGGRFNDEE
jgi:Spy/CpxP family protein refolding chaperone